MDSVNERPIMKTLIKKTLVAVLIMLPLTFAVPAANQAYAAGEVASGKDVRQAIDYLIGTEDILDVSVWKNNDLSKVVVVRPDGKISLPLIGDIHAAGFTPNQLRDLIIKRLKEYQETAVASVIVQAVNSYRVFILGEIKTPGSYLLKSKTSVLQAIAMSGGFTQYASKNKIILVRQKDDGVGTDKIRISFDDIVYSNEKADGNLMLKPGDTIFVP